MEIQATLHVDVDPTEWAKCKTEKAKIRLIQHYLRYIDPVDLKIDLGAKACKTQRAA